jgi:hypothetical protein
MRLEDKAIAKMRDRMSHASITELIDIKKEIKKSCKGGNEQVIFDESLMRDVYAYAIISFLNIYNVVVFGGFVASHISGKPWDDIDVMTDPNHVMKVISFLRLAFGFKPMDVQMQEGESKRYSKGYIFKIHDGDFTHTIKMDIVPALNTHWIPVTVGKCLMMKDNVVSLRQIPTAAFMLHAWKVNDIVEMLRNGHDVGLSFPIVTRNTSYSEYWWLRIRKVKKQGFDVNKFLGAKPPEPVKGSSAS